MKSFDPIATKFISFVLFITSFVLFITSIPLMGSVFYVFMESRGLEFDYDYVFTLFLCTHLIGAVFAGIIVDCYCGSHILFWAYVLGVPFLTVMLLFCNISIMVYAIVGLSAFLSGFAPIITAYHVFEGVAVWKRGVLYGLGIGFGNLFTYLLFKLSLISSSLAIVVVALFIVFSGLLFRKYAISARTRKATTIAHIKGLLGRGVISLSISLLVFYSLGGIMHSLLYPFLGGVSRVLLAYMSTIPYFFVAIAVGLLADSIGRRPVGLLGFVLLGLGNTLLGLVYDLGLGFYAIVLVFAVLQIAYGFVDVYSMTILVDLCSKRIRGIVYSIGLTGILLGLLIGSTISSIMEIESRIHRITLIFNLLILLASVFNLLRVPETLPKEIIFRRMILGYIRKAKKVTSEEGEE